MIETKSIGLFLVVLLRLSCVALAQTDGVASTHLCSAGARDGQACQQNNDCPHGVCVKAQGVCDDLDGLPCDCKASTCSGQSQGGEGICQGGPSEGESCDVRRNCDSGMACIGSQKICSGGVFQGFSCLRDEQCGAGNCVSNELVSANSLNGDDL